MAVRSRCMNRANGQTVPSADAPVAASQRERLLDAARAEFAAHGLQRASIARIAKRGGVSPPTLYRHCGTKDDITGAVIFREVTQFAVKVESALEGLNSPEDRLVEAFVAGIRESRENPIVNAIKEHEPELLAVRLLDTADAGYRAMRSTVIALIAAGADATGQLEEAGDVIIRIIGTLLLNPTRAMADDTSARAFARQYLVAILRAANTSQASGASG